MYIKNKKLSFIYKVLIIIIGIISIIFSTGLLDKRFNTHIFIMFTTLSNILCVIYYLLSIITKKTYPFLYGLIIMSITLTFLVAKFILKMSFSFASFSSLAFLGLHYLVPIMTIFDYLLFSKKGHFKKYYPILWLVFPFIYLIICLITKTYTYPFIDVTSLGFNKVITNSLFIALAFIILGYILYFLDHLLTKHK